VGGVESKVLKLVWHFAGGVMSVAIASSSVSVYAEEHRSGLDGLSVKHSPSFTQKFIHSTQVLKQANSLLPESVESTIETQAFRANKSTNSLNLISQVDAPASEPLEPSVEPPAEDAPISEPLEPTTAPATDETPTDPVEPTTEPAEPTTEPLEPTTEPAVDELPAPMSSDRWQVSVAPYLFVPLDVEADVTVAGRSGSIDLGLGDILSFDRALSAGLRVEAWKSRFGLIFDGLYIFAKNSGDFGVTFPEGTLANFGINSAFRVNTGGSLSVRQGTIDLAFSYRLVDTVLGAPTEPAKRFPRLVFAPILGVRTNILGQELEIDEISIPVTPIGPVAVSVDQDFSFSRTFVEPMIGAQIGLDLSNRWSLGLRGDVSGFNINADKNFTWNLITSVQYHLSSSSSLQLAYRFNDFEFEDGSGLTRARVNLSQNGLLLSVIFRF